MILFATRNASYPKCFVQLSPRGIPKYTPQVGMSDPALGISSFQCNSSTMLMRSRPAVRRHRPHPYSRPPV
jgi:hypothetical protein